jgi:ATP-dependent HslUV protease ATP-binding subunit HslU
LENLTPREIVEYLDKYVIGQEKAKKTIAVALRNRYRRMKLAPEIQKDIVPKNILMIGDTGVGKTEIARRLASMMSLPFIKIEASKYTEVGFVGRDVESMVRDLANTSIALVKEEMSKANEEKIEAYVENKIIEQLLPPLPTGASESKRADYDRSFEKMQKRLENGELDGLKIQVEISQDNFDFNDNGMPNHIIEVQESISKVLGGA